MTLPAEITIRTARDDELERVVEHRNRYATPSQWISPAAARHMHDVAPEPNELMLLALDAAGAIVGVGGTSDGGMWASPDGSWRVNPHGAPEWRRRGLGTELLTRLEAHARQRGAARLIAAVRGTEPEGLAFGERHGYRSFHERIDSYIDVQTFDGASFADAEAAPAAKGIRLATYAELLVERGEGVEGFQRELLPVIWEMARDVPSPTPMPETPPPFEQARRMFFEGPGTDPASTVVALRDGKPVGMTVTLVKENGTAYTNFTGVVRAERGKGVALAMKLRALRELRARNVRLFGTTNDEQNAAMRGINRKLGYVPDPPTTMMEKRLT